MIRTRLLNAELLSALASMGHGDFLIVCDAGFPIPETSWRIDLALVPDVPNHELVLSIINEFFVAEKVVHGEELTTHNPRLHEIVQRIFTQSAHEAIPHDTIMFELVHQAKAIVRTGAFDPWGNILLYSGIDPTKGWFAKERVVTPPHYVERIRQMGG